MNISQIIAKELNIKASQVEATIALLDEGATVPFIARYRKEVTGGLSDTELRELHQRLVYLTELLERQQVILASIEDQGKLTPALKESILKADTKVRLEDLYLPYKPKRRTKAQMAIEAGLEPLANALLQDASIDENELAQTYVNKEKGVEDIKAALEGARHIIAEGLSENADLLQQLRAVFWQHGVIYSKVRKDKEEEGAKFKDYFEFSESIQKIPSHRLLAIFRGRKEGFLSFNIGFPDEQTQKDCCQMIIDVCGIKTRLPETCWLFETMQWSWRIKLHTKLELELMVELKNRADEEAINVFGDNLGNLLMAAPAGNNVVLGLDPGYRTGVKTVVIDGTGKLLAHTVILPHAPQKQWDKSLHTLSELCQQHQVKLISIGNGTASRETDQLAAELITLNPSLKMAKIVVSEAGASVYSASELAAKEFPDLDVSYRGAVSIARRLQDPLAELIKIDPKSIGVGQYQHDVNQFKLGKALDATLEDCVNAVGADINTASVPLLSSISGLNERTARNIVEYREQHGRYKTREEIKSVPRLGDKTFEQAAGFLRIIKGENPLDGSAVHPESYGVATTIAQASNTSIENLIGNEALLNSLEAQKFVTEQAGLPTIRDIITELKKPGRDPRPEFKMAQFADGVNEVKDLKVGMELEGVITNVANFGAFVDIGVHQDGLVHVSQIANRFVKDVHDEVKVGMIVKVRVLEVDEKRKRISLSMKSEDKSTAKPRNKYPKAKQPREPKVENAFESQLKDMFISD